MFQKEHKMIPNKHRSNMMIIEHNKALIRSSLFTTLTLVFDWNKTHR